MSKVIKHRNKWCWGKSTIIIIEGGEGIVTVSFDSSEPNEAVITGLSVHQPSRRKGLGTQLLYLAEEEAKENGMHKLVLYVEKNTFIYRWYKKSGFNEEVGYYYEGDPNIIGLTKAI